jgi:hypothetical protein
MLIVNQYIWKRNWQILVKLTVVKFKLLRSALFWDITHPRVVSATVRCTISQKSAYRLYIAAEVWNHAKNTDFIKRFGHG